MKSLQSSRPASGIITTMNDAVIDDLKQFIATTVSQQSSDIRDDLAKLDGKLSHAVATLDGKVDDLTAFMAEAIDNFDQAASKRHNNHEHRITKLESKAT